MQKNNLWFKCIPESVQPVNIADYILDELCPALQLPLNLLIMALKGCKDLGVKDLKRNSSCLVIAKFLNYADKELFFQAYRVLRDLQVQGYKIIIFQDFSATVSQKRREFTPICRHLFETNVRFSLLYPAKLRVVLNGQLHSFLTPSQDSTHLNKEGSPP